MRRPRPLVTSAPPSSEPLEHELPGHDVELPTQRLEPVDGAHVVEVADLETELAAELDAELDAELAAVLHREPEASPAPANASPVGRINLRGRLILIATLVVALALAGVGATFAHAERVADQAALEARTALAASQAYAFSAEQRLLREQYMEVSWAQTLAKQTAAAAAGATSLEAARVVLAGAPQAGADVRTALQASIDAAAAVVATVPTRSVFTIETAVATVAAPLATVVASQAAWQVAEDARLAAERAAAEAAAARSAASGSSRAATTTRKATTTTSSAGSAAASAPAATSSAPEFSAGTLGSAINAYRATQGLGALSVSRSGTLVAHAGAMAQAGSIWHSGSDNIVGYVQPSSAGALVQAWANSPAHNAWMLNTSVSSMQVGAVVLNNRLYGAVGFN